MTNIYLKLIRRLKRYPMPNSVLLGKWMASLFVVMTIIAIVWLSQTKNLSFQNVHVKGELRYLDREDVRLSIMAAVEGGFFNVDVSDLRDILLSQPWVQDASVRRVWPDSLLVQISERKAVACWRWTGLLDSNGVYFVPKQKTKLVNLPLLEGPDGMQTLVLKRYRYLQQNYGLSVTRLSVDDRGAWEFKLSNGLQILLGRDHFEKRVGRFAELFVADTKKKLLQADRIDMRYTNGFAVSWKKITEHENRT